MLDDLLLDELGRALVRLEKLGPLLDDLVVPRQVSSGENAGVAPLMPTSRPPVSVPMVDLKAETERLVGWWCGQLVDSCPEVGSTPADSSVVVRAAWLRQRMAQVERMPWAAMMAEDLVAQSRWVADVVDPPASMDAPDPLEVGPVKAIVSWCHHLGVQVSERSVWRWCQQGEIPSEAAPDGRMLVRLADVVHRARKRSSDQDYHGFGTAS